MGYVGNTASVVRFPYKIGDMKASGPPQTLASLPGGGGHRTRDIAFTPDGKHMLVSVGSHSNDDDSDTTPAEFHRADVLEFTPEGKFEKVYAWGIRNCVGETINPTTGELWCPPTNGTLWATTWFPTTLPTCRRTASTVGPGITWAPSRTRGKRGNARS